MDNIYIIEGKLVSESSYGFRPGRSAHDAVLKAQQYAQEGYRVVVDVDLEKFFDLVSHDILMDRLAKRIADKAVLRLIRRYLQAGIMAKGMVMEREKGTPQGGPLSPLLANVLLDEVDKALDKRGHRFARYADDRNVYLRSQKAGERVLRFLRNLYEKLRLRVNEKKTEVGPVFGRKFLGYCLRQWSGDTVKMAVAPRPQLLEPPGADPHAGWCGRGAALMGCPLCRFAGWVARERRRAAAGQSGTTRRRPRQAVSAGPASRTPTLGRPPRCRPAQRRRRVPAQHAPGRAGCSAR